MNKITLYWRSTVSYKNSHVDLNSFWISKSSSERFFWHLGSQHWPIINPLATFEFPFRNWILGNFEAKWKKRNNFSRNFRDRLWSAQSIDFCSQSIKRSVRIEATILKKCVCSKMISFYGTLTLCRQKLVTIVLCNALDLFHRRDLSIWKYTIEILRFYKLRLVIFSKVLQDIEYR